MAKMIAAHEIKVNQTYGILTNAGANTGIWTIAKVVKVSAIYATYEVTTGPGRVEKRKCKVTDIYDAAECAAETIRNRPEYAGNYTQYLG